MNKIKYIVACLAMVASLAAGAQGRKGHLHINEVMTANDASIVDDFGNHVAWIELFNSKYAPLEISSVYITTDSAKATRDQWYSIPLHDVNTNIAKRQHVVFFADGKPNSGTFHLSFELDSLKENVIYLFDSDKESLIDCVTVPVLPRGASYARIKDGVTVYDENGNIDVAKTWQVCDDSDDACCITPSGANVIIARNDKIEKFATMDENGFAMAAMAMAIVFSALAVLCISFLIISKIGGFVSRTNKMRSHGIDVKEVAPEHRPDHDSGEEIAAITMALHEHLNAHDNESTILTINKVRRAYSPWSSKIYNMRHLPERR